MPPATSSTPTTSVATAVEAIGDRMASTPSTRSATPRNVRRPRVCSKDAYDDLNGSGVLMKSVRLQKKYHARTAHRAGSARTDYFSMNSGFLGRNGERKAWSRD